MRKSCVLSKNIVPTERGLALFAVLERQGTMSLDMIVADIAVAPSPAAVKERLIRWADERSRIGHWSMTILEHARLAGADASSLRRQE